MSDDPASQDHVQKIRELIHEINNGLAIGEGHLRMLLKDADGSKPLDTQARQEKIRKSLAGIERCVNANRELRTLLIKS